jgi:hypothetical protein
VCWFRKLYSRIGGVAKNRHFVGVRGSGGTHIKPAQVTGGEAPEPEKQILCILGFPTTLINMTTIFINRIEFGAFVSLVYILK